MPYRNQGQSWTPDEAGPAPGLLPTHPGQTYTLPLGLGVPSGEPVTTSQADGRHLPQHCALVEDIGESLKTHKGWSVRTAGSKDAECAGQRQVFRALGLAEDSRTSSSLRSSSPMIMLSGQGITH